MRSPNALLNEFSAALQFPHWFGRNWDALVDSLHALDWEFRRSYFLIVINAHSLLADDTPGGLRRFFELLESVA